MRSLFFLLVVWPVFASLAEARVATAPSSADQRIINPAAAALREWFGLSLDIRHQLDQESVLELTNSSVDIETEIESLNSNTALRTGRFVWELSASPQAGTKVTTSFAQTSSGPNTNDNSSEVTIIPLQIVLATKVGKSLGLGLKVQYTGYNFDDDLEIQVATSDATENITQTSQLEGSFLVTAPGFIYLLGDSGFSIAYTAEFFSVKGITATQGTYQRISFEDEGVIENSERDSRIEDSLNIRKDVVGLGYLKKFSGKKNDLRLEFSYERMPPLTKEQGYEYGGLARIIAEINFFYFRLGVEASRKSGYYIDAYNLIPYFYKIDHLSTDPVQEISFFGGLKTSKGHSFGGFFSHSESTSSEKITVDSIEQKVQRDSVKYGINYSYYF